MAVPLHVTAIGTLPPFPPLLLTSPLPPQELSTSSTEAMTNSLNSLNVCMSSHCAKYGLIKGLQVVLGIISRLPIICNDGRANN